MSDKEITDFYTLLVTSIANEVEQTIWGKLLAHLNINQMQTAEPASLPIEHNRIILEDLPEIISVEQAAKYLNISKNTAYTWCNSGDIPSFKIGNTRRIRKKILVEWIYAQESLSK